MNLEEIYDLSEEKITTNLKLNTDAKQTNDIFDNVINLYEENKKNNMSIKEEIKTTNIIVKENKRPIKKKNIKKLIIKKDFSDNNELL